MSRHEDSDEPYHSSSLNEYILEFRESIPISGVPLTSTSSTIYETSEQISTTKPSFYYSEIDATHESMHELVNIMNRFRSVCILGILWTLVFGGCVYYLTNINYIRFEVGVPVLGGIIAILIGFLIGLWRNK